MKILNAALIVISSITVVSAGLFTSTASAAFSKDLLMSDSVFSNKNAMTRSQIDNFLNKYPSSCISEENGHTFKKPIGYNSNDGFLYGSKVSAGEVIYAAAQAYDLNPQVLLATLQKEQSLISGSKGCHPSIPSPGVFKCTIYGYTVDCTKACQYDGGCTYIAVGYDCPGNCAYRSVGFSQQIIKAAWKLKYVQQRSLGNINWAIIRGNWDNSDDLDDWYDGPMTKGFHQRGPSDPGANYDGYFNIDSDTKVVSLKSGATAALYRYTPFTHGNEIFVDIFEDWFGSTSSNADFKSMKTPRWMEVKQSTKKVNPFTGELVSDTLHEGMQIYFDEVIRFNGKTYLRTAHDSKYFNSRGVLLERLKEVPADYVSLKSPRWMETTRDLTKIDPRTKEKVGDTLPAGTKLFFPTLTKFNGTLYLRSQADTHNDQRTGIPFSSLTDSPLAYRPFAKPRWMVTTRDTQLYDLRYPSASTTPITHTGTKKYFDFKTTINGRVYATNGKPADGEFIGFNLDYLRNIEHSDFKSMKYQKAYRMLDTLPKTDLSSGQPEIGSIAADTPVYFQTLIELNGKLYLRTAHDTHLNKTTVIPLEKVKPIDVTFEDMVKPRRMRMGTRLYKVDPVTLQRLDSAISKGRTAVFSQKISINGKLYLRSKYDSNHGHYKVVLYSALREL